ncbi:hypothetical protein SPURM210S_07587 [Streptomyces purpurascens]
MPWDPGGAGKPARTEAAGRRNGAGSPELLRGRSSGIHTAPSRVARQTAPDRVASSSPGSPRSRSSGCPPCRNTSRPQISSRTPGCESAPRSLRSTVSVLSRSQSIRRCSWRKKSRHTTWIPGSLCGRGLYEPSAYRRTAWRTAAVAASAASLRYTSLLPAGGTGKGPSAHTSPASIAASA